MHIDVTSIAEHDDSYAPLVGSVFELGTDAAKVTWNNAIELALATTVLNSEDKREAARDYFREMGFSEDLANYTHEQLEALLVQEVKHNLRHIDDYMADHSIYHYDEMMEHDWEHCFSQQGGNLTYDSATSKWEFYLGH